MTLRIAMALCLLLPLLVRAQVAADLCNNAAPCSCASTCRDAEADDAESLEEQIVCGSQAVQTLSQALASADTRAALGIEPVVRYPGDVLVVRTTRPPAVSRWSALQAAVREVRGQAEPNHTYRLQAPPTPNDEQFALQWALAGWTRGKSCVNQTDPFCTPDCSASAAIGAAAAWEQIEANPPAQPVVIGVVDQIPDSLDDLRDNLWRNPKEAANGIDDGDDNAIADDIHGYDAVKDAGIDDAHLSAARKWNQKHGTAVAGIIAAIGNNGHRVSGVLWKAQLVLCRATDTAGQLAGCLGYFGSLRRDGVPLVAVNVSLGGNRCSCCVESQLRALRDQGVLVVAAAGNEGCGNGPRDAAAAKCFVANSGPICTACPLYPASNAVSNVISVGASSCSGAPSSCSNFGARSVHLFAPGMRILSLGVADFEFTSAAAPHVTGAIGLLKSTPSGAALDWRALRSLVLAGGEPFAELLGTAPIEPRQRALNTITGRYLKVSAPAQPSGDRHGMLDCTGQRVRRRVQPVDDHVHRAANGEVRLVALDVICAESQPPVRVVVERQAADGGWTSVDSRVLKDDGEAPDECAGDGEHTGSWQGSAPGAYRLRFWNPQGLDDPEDLLVDIP